MRGKVRLLGLRLIGSLYLIFLISLHSQAQNTFESELSNANKKIATDFIRSNHYLGENFCFSPFLITGMLGWLQIGATNQSFEELSNLTGLENDVFLSSFESLSDSYANNSNIILSNSLWINDDSSPINSEFVENSKVINAHVERVDFQQTEDATDRINTYTFEKTKGKIVDFLAESFLSSNTEVVLLNSLYIKNLWKKPFDKENTFKGNFYDIDNTSHSAEFMKIENGVYNKFASLEYEAICLPFVDDQYEMIFLKPFKNTRKSIENIVQTLDLTLIENGSNRNRFAKVEELIIPKFTVRSEIDLKKALMRMGLNSPFTKGEFEKIKPGLVIYDALHTTFIEVSEDGTEAASSSAVAMNRSRGNSFILDRTFIYLLFDKKEKMFLLIGVFSSPK